MQYESAFDLLGISSSRNRQLYSRPGHDDSESGPGWSNKDDRGNSSIAQRNRSILQRQTEQKQYENYMRENYGSDWREEGKLWGITGFNSLTREQQREARQYDPTLSSSERNAQRRNNEQQRRQQEREATQEAMSDYVAQKEKEAKGEGRSWTNSDAADARMEFQKNNKDKEGTKDGDDREQKKDDESEAKTSDIAAQVQEADSDGDGVLSSSEIISLIDKKIATHAGITNAHHQPYGT